MKPHGWVAGTVLELSRSDVPLHIIVDRAVHIRHGGLSVCEARETAYGWVNIFGPPASSPGGPISGWGDIVKSVRHTDPNAVQEIVASILDVASRYVEANADKFVEEVLGS